MVEISPKKDTNLEEEKETKRRTQERKVEIKCCKEEETRCSKYDAK